MFTQAKVRAVSDYAALITGRTFGLQGVGSDIGNGVRYIDGRRQTVWFGPCGARRAASYYLGVIDAFNPGAIGDLPADVNAVRAELAGNGWSEAEASQGHDDANGFMAYHIARHTFSLAAIRAMPAVHEGQYADIKFSNGAVRIGLARTGIADGEPYDNKVTVDELQDGSWVTVREYEAK